MSNTTSKAAKVWAIVIIFVMIVMYSATAVALAVSMMAEEDTSVVRAEEIKNTTHEVLLKATMPEISIEELEATSVQYKEKYLSSVNTTKISYTEYTVKSGDSLWSIASKFYDDGSFYPFIMNTNNLKNECILPGQKLKISFDYGNKSKAEILNKCYENITKSNKNAKQENSSVNKGDYPSNYQYVGNYKITGYDPWCSHCCGKADGITASGVEAKVGRTIAAKGFKYGTKLYIEGYGVYVVEDTGGFATNTIDMAAESHQACYALTKNNVPVYVVN